MMDKEHKNMSKEMVSEKISKMMHEGKKREQAVAVALSMARQNKKKKMD